MITTRKLKVRCENKEFYSFLRMEQREQNKALNMAISYVHTSTLLKNFDSGAETRIKRSIEKINKKIDKLKLDLNKENIKEKKKLEIEKAIKTNEKILEGEKSILKEGKQYRKGLDKQFEDIYISKNNLYQLLSDQTNIQYMSTIDLALMKVKDDYKNNFGNIVNGKCSLMNYKSTFPLMLRKECVNLFKENDKYFIRIMFGYELEVVLGRRENENILELRSTLEKILNKEYEVKQSSIEFDRNNNVILNLCMEVPDKVGYTPIKGRTLGVDLGIAVPAYMCINDDTYKRMALGNINNFLRVKVQMQERRRKLQKDLKLTNGGRGRTKKLQLLDKLKENESNFCRTYNHKLSKEIISFAKKNKCEFINMEKLTKDGFPDSVLRNWSYYQLQTMVKYKAKREGIEVRFVNPAYTSQTCSKCGNIDKANRPKEEKGQAYFKCTGCGFELNADHNASINISRSTEFISDDKNDEVEE